jgi:hypothetical protein
MAAAERWKAAKQSAAPSNPLAFQSARSPLNLGESCMRLLFQPFVSAFSFSFLARVPFLRMLSSTASAQVICNV